MDDLTIDRTVTPHQIGAACATNSHCEIHRVDEINQPGDYLTCGECWHVFRTEQELLDAENALRQSFAKFYPAGPMREAGTRPLTSAEAIYSCPHCTHDF